MFCLITKDQEDIIFKYVNKIEAINISDNSSEIARGFEEIIDKIHKEIPDKKRISYGRYSVISKMGDYIYPLLCEKKIKIYDLVSGIFNNPEHEQFVRSLSIQLLAIHAERQGELENTLPFLEKAAMDKSWEVRECSAGFVRKIIKKHPNYMQTWYLKMVTSENSMQRRFACESLRPVATNGFLKKNPNFAFSIIQNLYEESEDYPRTSIGNSLSDWMKIDEKKTLEIVRTLANNGNKNSYWIAYRACRNLVKKHPILVMDILKTDQYIYKDRKFYRSNPQK